MKKGITRTAAVTSGVVEAWRNVGASFERFCVTAGIAALTDMMERDAAELCGRRYGREDGRCGHRWGQTAGKLGFHGGKMAIERPRVRGRDGHELVLPSWEAAQAEDWLGRWAMNLMLINVSTRGSGTPFGCQRAIFQQRTAPAYRSRRRRVGSWRCRRSGCANGWRPTCLRWICW